MTKLIPLELLSVKEYFNIINWENRQTKTVKNQPLIPWQNLTVAQFFINTNWSGITINKYPLEKPDFSLKDVSLLSVEQFFRLSNWNGIEQDFSQEEKPLSLNLTVKDFFQGIKWEQAKKNFQQKEENLQSFRTDENSFSLDDLSGLF